MERKNQVSESLVKGGECPERASVFKLGWGMGEVQADLDSASLSVPLEDPRTPLPGGSVVEASPLPMQERQGLIPGSGSILWGREQPTPAFFPWTEPGRLQL